MFGFFEKKKTEAKAKENPPVGAMFSDDDRPEDNNYIRIVKIDEDAGDWDKLRIEHFPWRNTSYMNVSVGFLKKYTRLTPEEEKKWEEEFFSDRKAYFKREDDKQKQEWEDQRKTEVASKEAEIKSSIDDETRHYVVIKAANAKSFEDLLNYAHGKFRLVYCGETQGILTAVLER